MHVYLSLRGPVMDGLLVQGLPACHQMTVGMGFSQAQTVLKPNRCAITDTHGRNVPQTILSVLLAFEAHAFEGASCQQCNFDARTVEREKIWGW